MPNHYNNPYGTPFNASPQFAAPQQQQQQQQGGQNPLAILQAVQQLKGLGASAPAASSAAPTASSAAAGGGAAAAGGGSSAAGGASALAGAGPAGIIAAAVLAQNVAHNKGISSWQAGFKGQAGRNVGDHYLEQWGANEGPARQIAGLFGLGKGAGLLNLGNLNAKIFGETA